MTKKITSTVLHINTALSDSPSVITLSAHHHVTALTVKAKLTIGRDVDVLKRSRV